MTEHFCSYVEKLANGNAMRALRFDTMKHFVRHSKDMDDEVSAVCSNLKDHMLKDPELVQFAQEHVKNAHMLVDLCLALQKILDPVQEGLISRIEKLQEPLDEEKRISGCVNFDKIQKDLKDLKEFNEISSGEIVKIFSFVNKNQNRFLTRLNTKRKQLDKKLWYTSNQGKASRVLFMAASVTALIGSFIELAVGTSSINVPATVVSASLIRLGNKCINQKHERVLEAQQKALRSMLDGTLKAINNVFGILVSAAQLKTKIRKIMKANGFTTVTEKNKKLESFLRNVKKLRLQAYLCGQGIKQARIVAQETNTKPPDETKSNRWKNIFSFFD